MRILKYTLVVVEVQTLFLPPGAKYLTVQIQHGQLQLWALIDPGEGFGVGKPSEGVVDARVIRIYGTGHPIADHLTLLYIATVQDINGFVWHVFEDLTPKGKTS